MQSVIHAVKPGGEVEVNISCLIIQFYDQGFTAELSVRVFGGNL